MAQRSSLGPLFEPQGVVVVGASEAPGKIGYRVLRNLVEGTYSGPIEAVNPRGGSALGVPFLTGLSPGSVRADLAILTVPSGQVPGAVRSCAAAGVGAAVVIAADHAGTEPGSAGVEGDIGQIAAATGIRVLGPNTVGFFALKETGERLQATYLSDRGQRGVPAGLAVIGQGGGLTNYVGSESLEEADVIPRFFVDTGNEVDVDIADCILFMLDKPDICSIGLVLESARGGRRIARAVQAATTAGVQVTVLALGRTDSGRNAADLHTGALSTGNLALWHELRARDANVLSDERDFVACLKGTRRSRMSSRNDRVALISWSGGFGVHAADLCSERGIRLARFEGRPTAEQEAALRTGTPLNPLDLGGYNSRRGEPEPAERLRYALEYVLGQPETNTLIVWEATILQQQSADSSAHVAHLAAAAHRHGKRIAVCGEVGREASATLHSAGVMTYRYPSDAVAALGIGSMPWRPTASGTHTTGAAGRTSSSVRLRSGTDAYRTLEKIGIRIPRTWPVPGKGDLRAAAEAVGLPFVLKMYPDETVHKSDLGLIQIVPDIKRAEEAYDAILRSAAQAGLQKGAIILAEQYASGLEIALGAHVDSLLGPTVMVGSGGTSLEILGDVAFALAPTTRERACQMIDQLAISPLLRGARTLKPYDIEALVDAIVAVSNYIAAEGNGNGSIDINPVMVGTAGAGVTAVDCVIAEYS